MVASGLAPTPASARAAATLRAVCTAVPGGGVHLIWVVNLDNLYRLEVACRLRRELGGENRTNRKVRGDEHTHLGVLSQQFAQGVQTLGGPTGRTDTACIPCSTAKRTFASLDRERSGQ